MSIPRSMIIFFLLSLSRWAHMSSKTVVFGKVTCLYANYLYQYFSSRRRGVAKGAGLIWCTPPPPLTHTLPLFLLLLFSSFVWLSHFKTNEQQNMSDNPIVVILPPTSTHSVPLFKINVVSDVSLIVNPSSIFTLTMFFKCNSNCG